MQNRALEKVPKVLSMIISMNVVSFFDFEASFVLLFEYKIRTDRFRTVFDLAVVCQLFQAP